MNQDTAIPKPEFEGWAILEIMGHTKVAGNVREVSMGGTVMMRVDVPTPDGQEVLLTQYYGGSSLFSVTPCTMETVLRMVEEDRYSLPMPVRLAIREREKDAEDLAALPSPDDDEDIDQEDPTDANIIPF